MFRIWDKFSVFFLIISFVASIWGPGFAQESRTMEEMLSAGDGLIKEGKYGEALIQYQKASESAPDDGEPYYKIGIAQFFLKNYDEAIKSYNKAIELNPDHFRALNNLALIYKNQDDNIEATRLFKRAIDINPDYKLARYNLGVVLYKRDRLERTEEVARELIQLNPDYDKGYYLLGLVLESSDKYDEAEQNYEKALKLSPKSVEAADGIKRIAARKAMSETQKASIEAAQKIAGFKLPAEYEFAGIKELKNGGNFIHIKYQEDQNLYLAKFPDAHVIGGKDVKSLLDKPGEEFSAFLEEMDVYEVSVLEVKKFQWDNGGEDNEKAGSQTSAILAENAPFVIFGCVGKGTEAKGIVSLLKVPGDDRELLFLYVAPVDKFAPSVAQKFLGGVGAPEKTMDKSPDEGKDEKTRDLQVEEGDEV